MQITKEKSKDVLVVKVAGRLDANSAPSLDAEVKDELPKLSTLRLDATNLAYISSAGLRVLLDFHKEMSAKGGSFTVVHPCDEVMEIFEMTGFSEFLTIEK